MQDVIVQMKYIGMNEEEEYGKVLGYSVVGPPVVGIHNITLEVPPPDVQVIPPSTATWWTGKLLLSGSYHGKIFFSMAFGVHFYYQDPELAHDPIPQWDLLCRDVMLDHPSMTILVHHLEGEDEDDEETEIMIQNQYDDDDEVRSDLEEEMQAILWDSEQVNHLVFFLSWTT